VLEISQVEVEGLVAGDNDLQPERGWGRNRQLEGEFTGGVCHCSLVDSLRTGTDLGIGNGICGHGIDEGAAQLSRRRQGWNGHDHREDQGLFQKVHAATPGIVPTRNGDRKARSGCAAAWWVGVSNFLRRYDPDQVRGVCSQPCSSSGHPHGNAFVSVRQRAG